MGWHRNNGNFVDFACHPSCKSFYLTFFYLFLKFSAAIPFCHVILLWHRPTKGGSWSIWLPLFFSSMGVFYTLMLCFAFWCQFIVFFNMYHWGSTGSVFNSTPSKLIPVTLGRLARLLDASFEIIAEISRTGAYSHRCLVFFQPTVFANFCAGSHRSHTLLLQVCFAHRLVNTFATQFFSNHIYIVEGEDVRDGTHTPKHDTI